jgi:DNA-binding transcriptional regulator YdaS (Cro superfamily)
MKANVKRVIQAVGSKAELAKALNISRSAITQWRNIPVNRVVELERITGIPRHELRPDIFGQGAAA